MTLNEWGLLGSLERTNFLERNFKINGRAVKRGLLYGVGVNDADYFQQPRIEGRQVACPAYMAWKRILERAYSDKLHIKRPTYIGVTVHSEWHSFSNFRMWWIENQVEGYEIDKDILSDCREYSPSSCLFVPQWINSFTTDCRSSRGEWPIGVSYCRTYGKFIAQCRNTMSTGGKNLGYFSNPESAHNAWLNRKLELALELKPKMDEIDERIYQRIVEIIMSAK